MWKKQSAAPIVDGEGETLRNILKNIESCMSGGKIVAGKGLSRQSSFAFSDSVSAAQNGARPALQQQQSFGLSKLEINAEEDEEDALKDPREWLKVIDAFEQPRLVYNISKKSFDRSVYEIISFCMTLIGPEHKRKPPYSHHRLIKPISSDNVIT